MVSGRTRDEEEATNTEDEDAINHAPILCGPDRIVEGARNVFVEIPERVFGSVREPDNYSSSLGSSFIRLKSGFGASQQEAWASSFWKYCF